MPSETYLVLRVPRPQRDDPFGKPSAHSQVFKGAADARPTSPDAAAPPGSSAYRLDLETLDGREYRELTRDKEVHAIARPIPIRLIRPVAQALDGPGAGRHDPDGATWGLTATGALTSPYTGRGVCVAILDTGIDADHEAFRSGGLELVQKDFTGEGNGDRDGHGTHVAATVFGRAVGGRRIGVAPGVSRALIGKVIGQGTGADTQTLIEAIRWATDSGARIVNLSLGFDFPGLVRSWIERDMPAELATSRALEDYRHTLRLFDKLALLIAAQSAEQQRIGQGPGALLVAAAGNESRRDLQADYRIVVAPPAAAEEFVSVGALATAGAPHDRLAVASFSNLRPSVCAPGVGVCSAQAHGGLVRLSGTSMASPHVTGLAALWAERQHSQTGSLSLATLAAQIEGRAGRDRLAQPADPADIGAGLVCAPQD